MKNIRRFIITAVAPLMIFSLACAADTTSCKEHCPMPAPIVFFDIAGPDAASLRAFYSSVFGWTIGNNFAISKADAGLNGTLRQDPKDKIIYLGVPDVAKALTEIVAAGGTIVAPRFEVPGIVVLGLFTDPAGNSMGLVEMQDGKPKIPKAAK
jgi:predicted enzyme related to lactoylglutathione lyase